jgi:DNA-binding Lrp family transcriptional regulator
MHFTATEKLVINTIQQEIELIPAPFSKLAKSAGMRPDDYLAMCRHLQRNNIIRRYGASINHRNAGFKANAMVGWMVSPALVESTGRLMAARREISHCYERKTNPDWRYNLFSMIHSQTKEGCDEVVKELSAETGLTDYVKLYSTGEIKKTRIKYPV